MSDIHIVKTISYPFKCKCCGKIMTLEHAKWSDGSFTHIIGFRGGGSRIPIDPGFEVVDEETKFKYRNYAKTGFEWELTMRDAWILNQPCPGCGKLVRKLILCQVKPNGDPYHTIFPWK